MHRQRIDGPGIATATPPPHPRSNTHHVLRLLKRIEKRITYLRGRGEKERGRQPATGDRHSGKYRKYRKREHHALSSLLYRSTIIRSWYPSPAQPHLIPTVLALHQNPVVRHRRGPEPRLGVRQRGTPRGQRVAEGSAKAPDETHTAERTNERTNEPRASRVSERVWRGACRSSSIPTMPTASASGQACRLLFSSSYRITVLNV